MRARELRTLAAEYNPPGVLKGNAHSARGQFTARPIAAEPADVLAVPAVLDYDPTADRRRAVPSVDEGT